MARVERYPRCPDRFELGVAGVVGQTVDEPTDPPSVDRTAGASVKIASRSTSRTSRTRQHHGFRTDPVLAFLLPITPHLRDRSAKGEGTMMVVAGILGILLLGYLVAALVFPERLG